MWGGGQGIIPTVLRSPLPPEKFKYDFTDHIFLNEVLKSSHNNHSNTLPVKKLRNFRTIFPILSFLAK